MRHRLRLSLHDEFRLDAAMLDYLEDLPATLRNDMMQRFARVGFQMLVEEAELQAAYAEACLPALREVMDGESKSATAKMSAVCPVPKARKKVVPVAQEPMKMPQRVTQIPQVLPPQAMPEPRRLTAAEILPLELVDADPAALAEDGIPLDSQSLNTESKSTDAFSRMRKRAQANS